MLNCFMSAAFTHDEARKFDIVHCNDLSALPVGVLIKIFSRSVKIVYDCHEYEVELYGLSAAGKFFRKKLEGFLINFADI